MCIRVWVLPCIGSGLEIVDIYSVLIHTCMLCCMLCVGLHCLIYFVFVYRCVGCMHVMYTLLNIIYNYMYVHVCIV